MRDQIIAIVGAGSGISLAVAEKFGSEGFTIALIARSEAKLKEYQSRLFLKGYKCFLFVADASKEKSLKKAVKKISDQLGDIDVLVYNAAINKPLNILEETSDHLAEDFKTNVGGALSAVKLVLTPMKIHNSGTIILTGGGLATNPHPDYGSLALGKAAIRNLAYQLAHQLHATDIKVGTVTIAGMVNPEDPKYNPISIAEQFWKIHAQVGKNTVEIPY
jgi:NADP-dependent 3-hydroxy acid dehydrogenase YdfG